MPRVSFETQLIESTCEQSAKPAIIYREIAKISPGLIFFKGPFWRGLFLGGLIFGGAYLRREVCVSKRLGWPYSWKEIYRFALCDFVFEGNFQVQAPGGLIFGGAI